MYLNEEVKEVPQNNQSDKSKTSDNNSGEVNAIGEPKKPKDPNIFRKIQNKALDANVQFKKKVAKGRRDAVDARNAGKAVAKIPMSVTDAVKKQISDWDEMDDNKRKEYIIKPGNRKRYFRALQIVIEHYVAFLINPVLNIVVAICHGLGKEKDVRIRNELIRELQAEINVTKAKIEDASSDPTPAGRDKKYKLMRIEEKLKAELVRVTANAKSI